MPGVRKAFFDNIKIGMEIGSFENIASRKGPILVMGADKKSCYDTIAKVKKILDVRVTDGSNGRSALHAPLGTN